MRDQLRDRLDAGEQFVVEIAYQCWTPACRLRHPRFVRLRPDKDIDSCAWAEQALEDLQ